MWDSAAGEQMSAIFENPPRPTLIHPCFCAGKVTLILSCLHKWQV